MVFLTTPTQKEVARIWAEVLALDEIGINDKFWDLGGHSLAASQIISRVIEKFRLQLPIKTLFESPTVAEMAAVITQNEPKNPIRQIRDGLLSKSRLFPRANGCARVMSKLDNDTSSGVC